MKKFLFVFAISLMAPAQALAFGSKRAIDNPSFWDDPSIPAIKTGYYQVLSNDVNQVFGDIIFLRNESYFDEDSKVIYGGLRGVFSGGGEIESQMELVNSEYKTQSFWKKFKQTGTFRITRISDRELRDEAGTVFIFYGSRLPVTSIEMLSHRGYAYYPPYNRQGIFPQNTMESFEHALMAGYAGFELDVRITGDHHLIVNHDTQLKLTTNCKLQPRLRMIKGLRQCVAESSSVIPNVTSTPAKVKAKLVGLEEVMNRFLSDERVKTIVVDVKDIDAIDELGTLVAFRRVFKRVLRENHVQRSMLNKIEVIHRRKEMFERLKKEFPEFRYALEGSTGTEPITDRSKYVPEVRGEPRGVHDVVSLNLGLTMMLPSVVIGNLVRDAHRYSYGVLGWTINGKGDLARTMSRAAGLDRLLSDSTYEEWAELQIEEFTSPGFLQAHYPLER